MLTLDKCRQLLGKHCQLSDVELETLRDQMYELAKVLISSFLQNPCIYVFLPFDSIAIEETATVCIFTVERGL